MKSEMLQEFKQFLAEEWEVGVEEISDKQVLAHYRKRWGVPSIVVVIVFALYFSLQLSGKHFDPRGRSNCSRGRGRRSQPVGHALGVAVDARASAKDKASDVRSREIEHRTR